MANRLPLVFDGTEIEQLQSGDSLVDAEGHGFADSENDFSAQGFVIQTANTARGIEETAVETGDLVTAAIAFGTDNVVLRADGTGRGAQFSRVVVLDSGELEFYDTNDDKTLEIRFDLLADNSLYIGLNAGGSITSGGENTVVGQGAGRDLTSGTFNTLVGHRAGEGGISCIANICIGYLSGFDYVEDNAAFIGFAAGRDAVGRQLIGIGVNAARASTGSDGTCIGTNAGNSAEIADGIFVGNNAGRAITSGSGGNTIIGGDAAHTTTSQQDDVDSCIIIGNGAFTTGSNAISIGAGVGAAANEIRIGDDTFTKVYFPGILAVDSDPVSEGQLWVDDGFVRISDGGIAQQLFDSFVAGPDPDASTDNALTVWDGTTGRLLKDSSVDVDDVVTYPLTRFETYGAGTAYTLTATPAAVDMGTTDPVVVLTQAGTYKISMGIEARVVSTAGAERTATFKLRRTNNTAADLTNGLVRISRANNTAGRYVPIYWEASEYVTANADDSLTIFASVSSITNFTVSVEKCFIKAERIE